LLLVRLCREPQRGWLKTIRFVVPHTDLWVVIEPKKLKA
jgi:hypothetical protein